MKVDLEIAALKNPIQNYSWGSKTVIADLLSEPTPSPRPQAELWIGAHPKAPSEVWQDDRWVPLPSWIQTAPEAILGPSVAARFRNTLPFLLKVLAAELPLSIQAHPNMAQAKAGFARENAQGLALDAADRNYRDASHKPELICALTPFCGLKGFRQIPEIQQRVRRLAIPALLEEVRRLAEDPAGGLERFFRSLLTLDATRQAALVAEVVRAAEKLAAEDPAWEWIARLNQSYPGDIGVISPLFLNLFELRPGEAMFIQAGTLHAYLHGAGIELMANSDNVLRGGLTSKHIDIDELTRCLDFSQEVPALTTPVAISPALSQYPTPAEEFLLSIIRVRSNVDYVSGQNRCGEVLLCTAGQAVITNLGTHKSQDLNRGKAVFVPACVSQYRIGGDAVIYMASVAGKRR